MCYYFTAVPPSIIVASTSVNEAINVSVTLFCLFNGFPLPFVVWKKNGEPLITNTTTNIITQPATTESGVILLEQLNISSALDTSLVSVLQFHGVQRKDNGIYACQGTNSLASTGTYNITSAPITITVLGIGNL